MGDLMNTKEVAEYLGIHEKKVYYLIKIGGIPCTRATGKWIFPKKFIDEWIEQSTRGASRKPGEEHRTSLLAAGSDDPSLGILRDLYSRRTTPTSLFMATTGSMAGLAALRDGVADFALAHLLDGATGEYNLPFIQQILPSGAAAVVLFYRELGLVVKSGNPLGLRKIGDLARTGLGMINRQAGSGTRHYLDQEFARLGIDSKAITGYDAVVSTHMEVGLSILHGKADAGLATQATARLLGLDFVPFTRERFDILISKERFFSRGFQILLEIVGSGEFRSRLEAVGGYDTSESGRMIATN